ncbi:hypothetical protein Y032_0972g3255 [Ancylostoma ceylanicum]|uniref:Uncharacterized protein n=1 Tax=Ancylostoma ceylanicum TaxID=53326 RepID=A0A016W8A5_9BILA|nr:hypothetical protein Y032_0972g3255 [Ancylostoma ceylanicum]
MNGLLPNVGPPTALRDVMAMELLPLQTYCETDQICSGSEELAKYCRIHCNFWRGDTQWDNNFKYFVTGAIVGAIGMACMHTFREAMKFVLAVYHGGGRRWPSRLSPSPHFLRKDRRNALWRDH